MRRTPRPCSGAASRSLLPSLAARTTTCSHPTTRRLTHARRKEAQLHTGRREGPGAAGRAQSRLGGRVPLSPRRRQESGGSVGSRRGLWAPSQPFCLSPLLSPGAGGRHGRLRSIGVVCGPLRGRDSTRAPLPHSGRRVVGARSWILRCRGEELANTRCVGDSLQTLPLLEDPPPVFPSLCTGAALEPWGLFQKRGLELPAPRAGPGLAPSCCCGGHAPSRPASALALCLPSFRGTEQAPLTAGCTSAWGGVRCQEEGCGARPPAP